MMKKVILIIFLLTGIFETRAQLFPVLGGQRAGISTAQFLKIGVGGRASALGDAFVAIANDASALYWNPAGLSQFSGPTKFSSLTISGLQILTMIFSERFIILMKIIRLVSHLHPYL